ncbi:MAG TPA: hypothetical protein VMI31_11805 [Fimbriimonadaceae bacterium]|nr:hypothetical protein [Fimbriimonadaceae bacterium]
MASLAIAGCQSSQKAVSGEATSSLAPGTGVNNTQPTPDAGQEPPKPTPDVPDDLKTDAYHWYGLANTAPINFEIKSASESFTGSQTVHLQSVAGGKAVYEIERTGGLGDQLGTDTVTLQKDGIYVTNTTKLTTKEPTLDMPSSVEPGKTWKNEGKFTMEGGHSFDQDITFTVVGEKPVKTEAGSYTGLLVKGAGQLTIDGKKYRMVSGEWYVKEKGLVKNEISMTPLGSPHAKPQLITIQETK